MQTIDANVSVFAKTLQLTGEWLQDIQDEANLSDAEHAYDACRAVLITLRDRLTAGEAADLSAQLPMLIRGFYYEQYVPAEAPQKVRSREEFLQAIGERLNSKNDPDPETACRAVFATLQKRLTPGQADHVREMLHKEIQTLWPQAA